MAATKAQSTLFAANTNVPAGTTRSAPVIGNTVDASTSYGGQLDFRITNSGALGAACTITFQTSSDGSNWFDYWSVSSSDLSSGTKTEGPSIPLGKGAIKVRPIAYGNTTSACTVEAYVDLVTGQ